MKVTIRDLYSKDETGAEMYRIVDEYADDLENILIITAGKKIPFDELELLEAFDVIRNIPYKQDKAPVEILARPLYINNDTGADCKKKSILMASYLRLNRYPYRFVAVSSMPDRKVHHVFTQALINGQWRNLDPTYQNAVPFDHKKVTRFEVLK